MREFKIDGIVYSIDRDQLRDRYIVQAYLPAKREYIQPDLPLAWKRDSEELDLAPTRIDPVIVDHPAVRCSISVDGDIIRADRYSGESVDEMILRTAIPKLKYEIEKKQCEVSDPGYAQRAKEMQDYADREQARLRKQEEARIARVRAEQEEKRREQEELEELEVFGMF